MMIIIITIFKIHKDNNLDILKSTKHQKYFVSAIIGQVCWLNTSNNIYSRYFRGVFPKFC